MALSDLQTALESLDAAIATLAAKAADPSAYTVEGLSVAKQKLSELLAARRNLLDAINDAAGPYEKISRWYPSDR